MVLLISDDNPEIKQNLESVSYSSRFAVGMYLSPKMKLPFPWDVKYVEDKIVRYVSIDPQKRGNGKYKIILTKFMHLVWKILEHLTFWSYLPISLFFNFA